ncbi:MAG: TRAP transporter large permease subunit [Pseudomonadota bacterium]
MKSITKALHFCSGAWRKIENSAVVVVLGGMVVLPVMEAVLRKFFQVTLPGAAEYVRHGTLWVAFIGAALAAREGSHLKLATSGRVVKGPVKTGIFLFHTSLAVAVAAVFIIAGFALLSAERANLMNVAPFLPTWIAQLPMTACMALIAIRFIQRTGGARNRLLVLLFAAGILCVAFVPEASRASLLVPAVAIMLLALIAGAPLFVVFGGIALFLFFKDSILLASVPSEAYRVVSSPTLPTIPLFTLAGYILSEGGASRRLVKLFHALFSWMPGGVAVATVLVCAFFTTFTGASGVTILALGGLLFPMLLKEHYPGRFSLGLVTASGSVGLLFPPSLPIIIYGVVAAIPIDKMFIGCLIPGVLLVVLMSTYGVCVSKVKKIESNSFSFPTLLAALKIAKWDLFLPVIVVLGIFGGFTTLVESAALTALYAIILECFIHREMKLFTGLPRTMVRCGEVVGGVLIILGFAFGFTNYLIDAEVPAMLSSWVQTTIHSKIVFLIILNFLLILVGCMMDIFSAIVVVVRIMLPIATAYGIDPVHLGVMFLVNLELGYLMPPVGLNLFFSAYRFNRPLTDIYRAVWPFLILGAIIVALVTYFPSISLCLINR